MTFKGKNLDAYRRLIFARMKQWTHNFHTNINTSIDLEQETIKAIFELRFNLGEGAAHLASATKGLYILACHTRTST